MKTSFLELLIAAKNIHPGKMIYIVYVGMHACVHAPKGGTYKGYKYVKCYYYFIIDRQSELFLFVFAYTLYKRQLHAICICIHACMHRIFLYNSNKNYSDYPHINL